MDGARLLAEGEPLELLDGSTVRVRFGMRSLLELERRFGGLAAVQSSISQDGTGAMIEPSFQLLACGLLHEHDRNGAPLTAERLADLLHPNDFQRAVETAAKAMGEAFPTPAQDGPGKAAVGSPGPSGTTPAPSPSGAAPTSSG